MSREGFLYAFHELQAASLEPVDVATGETKEPRYRTGYRNGFGDALREVAELIVDELEED